MINVSEQQIFNTYASVVAPHGRAMFSKYREPAYGFTVFEETTLDVLLAPIRRTRNIVVGITVLAAILGGLLSWRFSGHITRPILRLRDYVLQVEAGDLDTPLDFHSYAELNTLSDGIQLMFGEEYGLRIESQPERRCARSDRADQPQ